MIEVTCETCGERAGVQSLLAAAQQACGRCGRLLMGPLSRPKHLTRPSALAEPPPRSSAYAPSSPAALWLGMFVGAAAGLAVVGVVAQLGPALYQPFRGALLGALTGVLLAPVIAMVSFLEMLIWPWGLAGMLGDSTWTRLSKGINERRLRHFLVPILVWVVLPMTVCGLGGSRLKSIDTPSIVTAALGAVALGGVVGGACGAHAGKFRRGRGNRLTIAIDNALPPSQSMPWKS